MIYKKFNGINIENSLGVCSVNSGGRDTEMIAYHAAKLKPQSVLDVGTGTGFIPIYLASLGIRATGTDINSLAIELARKNAERNKLPVNFFVSDLFAGLRERESYDLICFNPPFGDSKSIRMTKFIETIKFIIRRFIGNSSDINSFLYDTKMGRMVSIFMKRKRKRIIQRFLNEYKDFLTSNGKALIWLHKSEVPIIKNYPHRIIAEFNDAKACLCLID